MSSSYQALINPHIARALVKYATGGATFQRVLLFPALILALVSFPGTTHAQYRRGGLSLYGAHLQTRNLGNDWGPGVHLFWNIIPCLRFEVEGTHLSHLHNAQLEAEMTLLETGITMRNHITRRLIVYAAIGNGFYLAELNTQSNAGEKTSSTQYGGYAGGGMEFTISDTFALFVQARWYATNGNTPQIQMNDGTISDDIPFDGTRISAGLSASW